MTARTQTEAMARLVAAIENAARLDDPLSPSERAHYDEMDALDKAYEGVTFLDEWKAGKR